MKIKSKLLLAAITICSTLFIGWGNVGHRIINTKTILSVTPAMSFWGNWSDSLAAHGSDADYRKSSDPMKHQNIISILIIILSLFQTDISHKVLIL